MIFAFILLALAIASYTISQLQQHGKLKWSKDDISFWGTDSDKRKYNSKFPFSTTILVWLTDGYHLMQFFALIFLSAAFAVALGFSWGLLLYIWIGVHIVHFCAYYFLQK
jgi:hypothetical protein